MLYKLANQNVGCVRILEGLSRDRNKYDYVVYKLEQVVQIGSVVSCKACGSEYFQTSFEIVLLMPIINFGGLNLVL